jgi:hypothetical protein
MKNVQEDGWWGMYIG